MEADLLNYAAGGGVLIGAAVLARRLLIVVVALTATWSRKAYRRRSAQQVLRVLVLGSPWVRGKEPADDA